MKVKYVKPPLETPIYLSIQKQIRHHVIFLKLEFWPRDTLLKKKGKSKKVKIHSGKSLSHFSSLAEDIVDQSYFSDRL